MMDAAEPGRNPWVSPEQDEQALAYDANALFPGDVDEITRRHAQELMAEMEAEELPKRRVRRGSLTQAAERVASRQSWPANAPEFPEFVDAPPARWWSYAVAGVCGFTLAFGVCACILTTFLP